MLPELFRISRERYQPSDFAALRALHWLTGQRVPELIVQM
jgi:hypothetical protein